MSKKKDTVKALLDIEADVHAATKAHQDEGLIQAALKNVGRAIGQLKSNIRTAESFQRPPERTSGGRSANGSAN